MASAAAWLVDRVIPEVPVRQWVLTLPFALRSRLAYEPALTSRILAEFVRAVFNSLRRRARRELGIATSRCGAVTFVQRAGDALNLNVHFHHLAIDGVYAAGADGTPVFYSLPPPDDDEVARVAARVARRIARVLAREGDASDGETLAEREPWLAALAAASVRGQTRGAAPAAASSGHTNHPSDYAWADLMRRVFAQEVLECPRCLSTMKIIAAIHPIAPSRTDPQYDLLPKGAPLAEDDTP